MWKYKRRYERTGLHYARGSCLGDYCEYVYSYSLILIAVGAAAAWCSLCWGNAESWMSGVLWYKNSSSQGPLKQIFVCLYLFWLNCKFRFEWMNTHLDCWNLRLCWCAIFCNLQNATSVLGRDCIFIVCVCQSGWHTPGKLAGNLHTYAICIYFLESTQLIAQS